MTTSCNEATLGSSDPEDGNTEQVSSEESLQPPLEPLTPPIRFAQEGHDEESQEKGDDKMPPLE